MNLLSAKQFLEKNLSALYSSRESSNIANLMLEFTTGWGRVDRILNKDTELTSSQEQFITEGCTSLLLHTPLQYILHEAWFSGMPFYVDENVLIPRPETEELVEWVNSEIKMLNKENITVTDIGTGSGCIAISLKKKNPGAALTAVDVSREALHIAEKNAQKLGAAVHFIQADFLLRQSWHLLPAADIVVSNPPYIPEQEKDKLPPNVALFEPAQALFVPHNNALVFYAALAEYHRQLLSPSAILLVEIHEDLAVETTALFEKAGLETVLRRDLQGKPRMIKAFARS